MAMLSVAWLLPLSATAACSRPIVVPVAPTGQSVIISDYKVSGAFPDLLKAVGAKAGCEFTFSVMPRARLEKMFEMGKADLLVAATHTDQRDQSGLFIPMFETRSTLISLDSLRAVPRTFDELLARRELRVALVRGFDFGPAYRELSKQLAAQGRLSFEADPLTVARLLNGGIADVTIMPPSVVMSAIKGNPRVEGMLPHLRITPLPELPWLKSGIYISNKSMGSDDRATLEKALAESVKSSELWNILKRYYPLAVLTASARAL